MSRCFLLYASVGFGVGETAVVPYVSVVPGSCPFSLVFRPVYSSFLIFVETSYVRYVAVVIVIDVIVSGIVRIVIMMVHPGLVNASVDNDDEAGIQIKAGIERRKGLYKNPLPVVQENEITACQIIISFNVRKIIITCSGIVRRSPGRTIV